jgi:hypothetical protein
MNLSQDIQAYLKYPVLQKIDPTTGQPEDENQYDIVSQSVLVIFLTGLLEATRTIENAAIIQEQKTAKELLNKMFTNKSAVLSHIREFTKKDERYIDAKLEEVANGYLHVIQQSDYADALQKEKGLEDLLSSERNKILLFLPSGLKTGELFNHQTIDDDTNKMEGPVSSLMNKIGNAFSGDD